MLVIGLTGSIGTGKSTTAAMFRERGVPTHDADAAVHRLYGGRAAPAIEAVFPGTTVDGSVDRKKLSAVIVDDASRLARLEAIVHPLVREEEWDAIVSAQERGYRGIVLDIPLLFETDSQQRCDVVVLATVSDDIQRQRVLQRPGMTEAKLKALKSRQWSDETKRAGSHFVVDTGYGFDSARRQVLDICRATAMIHR